MKIIENKIFQILKKTFPNSSIPKKFLNLKIGDLKEWDSLGNFNLLLAIEDTFKIKFSMKELEEIKSVKQLIKKLSKK